MTIKNETAFTKECMEGAMRACEAGNSRYKTFKLIYKLFGIIFAIGLMIIYFLLFYRGIRAAFVTDDKYSQLIAVGFSTMIACQTLVIIGGIFAVIPLTGITLPIIKYC